MSSAERVLSPEAGRWSPPDGSSRYRICAAGTWPTSTRQTGLRSDDTYCPVVDFAPETR